MFFVDHILTGERFSQATSAMPDFESTEAPVRRIAIAGKFDALAEHGLDLACHAARQDPAVKLVSLRFECLSAKPDVSWACEAVAKLSREKPTFAYVDYALGASLAIAAQCRAVVAHPCCEVGLLDCFQCEDQLPDEWEVQINAHTMRTLAAARPEVRPHVWARLLGGTYHGEQAEAAGIVDFLRSSERSMLKTWKW